ncbi:MAG: hypothetical protein WKF84_23230 [Pyrinomonadaceae bacterium]
MTKTASASRNADGVLSTGIASSGCRLPTEPFRFGNLARTLGDVRSQAVLQRGHQHRQENA